MLFSLQNSHPPGTIPATWLILFTFKVTFSAITVSNNGYYIGVYDDTNTYSWYEAKDYCMNNFGSSLASIHSSTDATNLEGARPNSQSSSWTGLNDVNDESVQYDTTTSGGWAWSDGTPYNYTPAWSSGEPNNAVGGQDCAYMYSDETWDDVGCEYEMNQFICNLEENWRPIFKITGGLADYGGKSEVASYWTEGESNYDGYYNDFMFINESFDASTIDTENNYRSLAIDDWEYLYNSGAFDKVKVNLYKDGTEVRYFIYNATSNASSWNAQSFLIDSSFQDTGYERYNFWGISGMTIFKFSIYCFNPLSFC